jgi:hypothetical protein
MKIQYSKKRHNFSLIYGVLFLTISLLGIFTRDNTSWTEYCFLIISLSYFGTYFYEKKNQYLTIENGVISVNKPFGKKVNLTEIKQIEKYAGDYTLKTDKTKLKINTQIIELNSLSELDAVLEKLNVESA